MDRQKIVYFFIGILLILLIVAEIVAYLLLRRQDVGLTPDAGSQDRIQTLNQVLISYFGNNWPMILIGSLVMVIFILILFLIITKKQIEINAEGKPFKLLNIAGIGFFIILSAVVLFATYRLYSKIQTEKSPGDENMQAIKKQKKQLIELFAVIVGLIILILVILGGGLWGYRKLKNKLGV